MRNIITLVIITLLSFTAHSQNEAGTSANLEIWNVEILNKNGFNFIEIDVYNSGKDYLAPAIQVIHEDIFIVNPQKVPEEDALRGQSFHKFSLPIEIPSTHTGKKIKLEILISNQIDSMSEKHKVKINS